MLEFEPLMVQYTVSVLQKPHQWIFSGCFPRSYYAWVWTGEGSVHQFYRSFTSGSPVVAGRIWCHCFRRARWCSVLKLSGKLNAAILQQPSLSSSARFYMAALGTSWSPTSAGLRTTQGFNLAVQKTFSFWLLFENGSHDTNWNHQFCWTQSDVMSFKIRFSTCCEESLYNSV